MGSFCLGVNQNEDTNFFSRWKPSVIYLIWKPRCKLARLMNNGFKFNTKIICRIRIDDCDVRLINIHVFQIEIITNNQIHKIFNNTFPQLALLTDASIASSILSKLNYLYVIVFNSYFKYELYTLLTRARVSSLVCAHQLNTKKPAIVRPENKMDGLEIWSGLFYKNPQRQYLPLGPRLVRIASVTGPPPRASKMQSYPYFYTCSLNSRSHSPAVIKICVAPSFRRASAWSYLLTKFSKGIFYFLQSFTNILPRAEEAAVWIIPLLFVCLKTSTNPIAVRGLITPELADDKGTSSSISNVVKGVVTENYCCIAPGKGTSRNQRWVCEFEQIYES